MKRNEPNANSSSCLKAYRNHHTCGGFLPAYYGIEVTRYCNFACVMCPHQYLSESQMGHMEWSLFCKIIDEIAPVAEIIKLHWIGEPLLHPKLCDMIRYARVNTDALIFMSTNAFLLQGEIAENIRTSGLHKIILSIDGASRESYESIRVNGVYNEVVSNAEDFIKNVEKQGGPLCEVKMIQFPENKQEVDYFINKWSTYECVSVNIMWLCTWAGQLPQLTIFENYLCPYDPHKRVPCADLWFKMQVTWEGSVSLCCFDWSETQSLGNLKDISVKELWQNELISRIRDMHLRGKYIGICGKCNEWARFEEYEFWYDMNELKRNPSLIWNIDW